MPRRGANSGAQRRDPDEEALDWVICLTSGMATDEQLDAFVRWRDAEPENGMALARARQLWTSVGEALVAGQERQVAARLNIVSSRRSWRRVKPLMTMTRPAAAWLGRHRAAVAGVAAAACAVLLSFQWPLADLKSGSAVRQVQLADGSVATLAPDTALDIAIGAGGERRIKLKQGEALFDVVHDPRRPFVVSSGQGATRVLGTAFSVRLVGGMTRVIVARGRVEVSSGAERRILTPDREVVYGLTTMGGIHAVDAMADLSWTRDRLIFDNTTLGDVIAELDRFDSRKIVLLNREARSRRVNAVIDLKRTDQWLKALERSERLNAVSFAGFILIR
ncbi:FecR family protein [Novosphingobium sp. CF614]|uniref:FecR family protein n=1 Tax=Novosphingobium sp. CF614 TaxID=1884364 RepID=UPI0008E0F6C9|nr:FecR domain-containing protein [Novosphingobium sp. CF614]SFF92358.1 FecR family protein [Novosphingobium sp. CF614]